MLYQKFTAKSDSERILTRAQQQLKCATAATIDMGRKDDGAAVPLSKGAGTPFGRLIQCGVGRGLLPYQVGSSSIQPSATIDMGQKWVVVGVLFFLGVAGSPSNTK